MLRSIRNYVVGLVTAMFLLAPMALAQVTTGSVTGRVVDSTGSAVPNVNVVLISEVHGNRIAPVKTNKEGDYVFPDITADTYTVEASAPSFKTFRLTGILVTGGDHVGVPPITLEVGGTTETVTVQAEATAVQTQSGERSAAIEQVAIESMPIAHSNFAGAIALCSGRSAELGWLLRPDWRSDQREQLHDERRLSHGHGQQRPDAEPEHRVDR